MSTDAGKFDDFLKRFDELLPEEREQLMDELTRREASSKNGSHPGRSAFRRFQRAGAVRFNHGRPCRLEHEPKIHGRIRAGC